MALYIAQDGMSEMSNKKLCLYDGKPYKDNISKIYWAKGGDSCIVITKSQALRLLGLSKFETHRLPKFEDGPIKVY